CEIHMSGFGNLQVLGATSEDVCEYYERGLEAPGIDCETPPPYLEALCDPLDSDGCVPVPQEPGLRYRLKWDYIEANRCTPNTRTPARAPSGHGHPLTARPLFRRPIHRDDLPGRRRAEDGRGKRPARGGAGKQSGAGKGAD